VFASPGGSLLRTGAANNAKIGRSLPMELDARTVRMVVHKGIERSGQMHAKNVPEVTIGYRMPRTTNAKLVPVGPTTGQAQYIAHRVKKCVGVERN
jgi:hypothetical protein